VSSTSSQPWENRPCTFWADEQVRKLRTEIWVMEISKIPSKKKSLTLWQNETRILHLALSNVQVYLINAYLKEEFTSKWKFRHHLLTLEWFQTRMSFSPLLNTKEDTVFWRMSVTRLLMDPIDFHSRKTKYYDLLWYFIYISSTVWLLKFFRTSSFVSSIFSFWSELFLIQLVCIFDISENLQFNTNVLWLINLGSMVIANS